MGTTAYPVFTIGHSNHPPETFLRLLQRHEIDDVLDVRSAPYSRYAPQFNHDALEGILSEAGIGYDSLGGVLGGRPRERSCYDDAGRVRYDMIATLDWFDDGIRSVVHRADERRVALMCTEKDPLECHRTLLVARALAERDVEVAHILADGQLESHSSAMDRLLGIFKLPQDGDMFWSRDDVVGEAISRQTRKIGHIGVELPADYQSSSAF